MTELYRIQGMRADTLERMADAAGDPEAALKRLSEALAVWMKIQKDPNDLAELTPAESRCKRLGEKILMLQNRSGRS
jgi:hypothetical protein